MLLEFSKYLWIQKQYEEEKILKRTFHIEVIVHILSVTCISMLYVEVEMEVRQEEYS